MPALPRRPVLVSLVLLLAILPAAAAEQGVAGVVRCPDGEAVSGLTVRANANGTVHEAVTDSGGAFRFAGALDNGAVLALEGDAGVGRVALGGGENGALELQYPVITEVVLLHDNDQHFDFNFLDTIAAEIEAIREAHPNVFLLNSGDIFVRHADRWAEPRGAWYLSRALFMIETMNGLRYDAVTAGNHELDYIGAFTRAALDTANFPLLAANIDVETELLPAFEPYTVLETAEGYTMAVVGLSVVNFDKPGVSDRDPAETLQQYAELSGDHDIFAALTHIGVNNDRALAEAVPDLDVILGGHSHTLLETPELVNGVLVAQAGGGGHEVDPDKPMYLGKVTITLENGTPVEKSGYVMRFTADGVEALGELAAAE